MRRCNCGLLACLLTCQRMTGCSADGAVPCSKLGTCGGNFNAFANDPHLRYDGYVHLDVAHDHVRLDRAPLGREDSLTRISSPGTRVSFVSNAHRIQAIFEYLGTAPCLPDCPRMADGSCYRPNGPCPNQCEVLVEVDGVRTPVAHTNLVGQPLTHDHKQRDFLGEIKLVVMDQAHAAKQATHLYTLTLPWGAPVSLKRIHLEHPSGIDELPSLLEPPGSSHAIPKYVAYGDAATLGWCSSLGYPSAIARLNGWISVNLGVAEARVQPEHGVAIGAIGP